MPTKSEQSDLRLDRIETREAHYQSTQHSCRSPTNKKRVESIELGSIGAHFDTAPNETYPERIEDLTYETLHPSCDSALRLRENIFHGQPEPNSSGPKEVPAASMWSARYGTYLPPSEMEEFRRQRSTNKKHPPPSISTTGDPREDDEPSPTRRRGNFVPSVANPTPSNRSICTTHEESRKGGNGSVFPYPGSEYNSKLGRVNGRDEK